MYTSHYGYEPSIATLIAADNNLPSKQMTLSWDHKEAYCECIFENKINIFVPFWWNELLVPNDKNNIPNNLYTLNKHQSQYNVTE